MHVCTIATCLIVLNRLCGSSVSARVRVHYCMQSLHRLLSITHTIPIHASIHLPSEHIPGAVAMRQSSLQRQNVWTELAKQRETRKHELQMAQLELKKEAEKAKQDKADGIKCKADVSIAKVAVEQKKVDLKEQAKTAKLLNRSRVQKLARHCYKVCVALHDEHGVDWHKKLCEIAKKHAVAGKQAKTRPCPNFFDVELDLLLDVTFKTHFAGTTKKSCPTTYCSDALVRKLFNGSQETSKYPNPRDALRVMLTSLLPGYHAVVPSEYHAEALLNKNNRIVDICFLEAAWRYNKHMGNNFPLIGAFHLPEEQQLGVATSPSVAVSSSSSPAASSSVVSSAAGPAASSSGLTAPASVPAPSVPTAVAAPSATASSKAGGDIAKASVAKKSVTKPKSVVAKSAATKKG